MIVVICVILTIICSVAGCSRDKSVDAALNDVLAALKQAGIQYEERAETRNIYDLPREGAKLHVYLLEAGNLTIYIFPTVEQRREVQRDPFPTATAIPPNGSFGIGKILVFYYNGDNVLAQKLKKAFEPLGVEERSQLN